MLGFKKGSRVNILVIFLFLCVSVIVIRLFQIQIIDHDKYVEMAKSEQVKRLSIPAKRGQIYLMDGDKPVPIVMNEAIYTLFLDPQIVKNADKVEEVIKKVAGGNIIYDVNDALSKTESRYQIVAKNLSRKQAELIKAENLSGVGFHENTARVYPEGQLASQTLGFVNAEGVGQYGVEGSLNNRLRGEDGLLQTITDVNMVPLTIGGDNTRIPAKNGDDIVLTLDRNIQAYAEKALASGLEKLGAEKGSVIVMNPSDSSVLAMANLPTYNPTDFSKVSDISVFSNQVLTDPYEPGSVIKTFIFATGIDKGVITPNSTYVNRGYVNIEDVKITNAYKGQIGEITFQTALNFSLNTGAVDIAQRLGSGDYITKPARETIYDYYYNRFGLGKDTGFELYEELGQIISPEEQEGNAVRYSNMAFGQGMNINMLQVATGFSAMINGGEYCPPTVIAGTMQDGRIVDEDKKTCQYAVSESTSSAMRQMLADARSFSFSSQDRPGFTIGGKTGTSETISGGGYIKDTTIATYLGFGGTDMPKYVIMVRVQGEGMNLQGNTDAEPIFADISNWLIQYLNLKP